MKLTTKTVKRLKILKIIFIVYCLTAFLIYIILNKKLKLLKERIFSEECKELNISKEDCGYKMLPDCFRVCKIKELKPYKIRSGLNYYECLCLDENSKPIVVSVSNRFFYNISRDILS